MGRPLKKDVNGVNVIGTYNGTGSADNLQAGIVVTFHDGTAKRTDGVIVKQRGAKTYVCTRIGNLSGLYSLNDSGNQVTCTLVATDPAALGEMRIMGSTTGLSPATTPIAKLTKRVATDFSGNRYTWYLSNYQDSTGDVIVLTPF